MKNIHIWRIFCALSCCSFTLTMKSSENTSLWTYISANGSQIAPVLKISGETGWEEMSTIFTVPSESQIITIRLNIDIQSSNGSDPVGWFDDIKIISN